MRVLDLFSGIGGISYGLESTGGFQTVGFCEIDQFCRIVLEKHWPNVPIWEDVCELSAESVRERCGRIDIIAGGFPCQPHSVAGKRKGQSDERHLWPEFARLVREIRPRWVLAENVPGIRSTAADEVIGDLEAEGYTVWPLVVGADDVGAPHRRKRVWFVARRMDDANGARLLNQGAAAPVEGGNEPKDGVPGSASHVAHRQESQRGRRRSDIAEPCCISGTWPARPGEPQHEWEEPRLAAFSVGGATDGLSLRLVRRSNREALKAYGNAVVPQVVYVIGMAILRFNKESHVNELC